MILTKDGGKVLLYAGASDREELEIPDGVTEISRGAFWNAASLRKITLPSSLETVAEYAFAECSRLKNIEFPEGTRLLGQMLLIMRFLWSMRIFRNLSHQLEKGHSGIVRSEDTREQQQKLMQKKISWSLLTRRLWMKMTARYREILNPANGMV